jgi:hypothetical protein
VIFSEHRDGIFFSGEKRKLMKGNTQATTTTKQKACKHKRQKARKEGRKEGERE